MLIHGEINPLAVFGLRRVNHCPPHFSKMIFDTYVPEKTFTDWIYSHLDGRFYYGEWYAEADSEGEIGRAHV